MGEKVFLILVFIFEIDSLIPPQQMDRLYHATEKSKDRQMHKIEDGDHNDTWCVDIRGENPFSLENKGKKFKYFTVIRDFIYKHQ